MEESPYYQSQRNLLTVPLASPREFAFLYDSTLSHGGMFVPGVYECDAGQQVRVGLTFSDPDNTVHIGALVRWNRPFGKKHLRAGMGVEFLPEEAKVRDLLLEMSLGAQPEFSQRHKRFAADIVVFEIRGREKILRRTDDVSLGGLFLKGQNLPPLYTRVKLRIPIPGRWWHLRASAEVIWHRTSLMPGYGVQFAEMKERDQGTLRTYLDGLRTVADPD